MKFVIPEPMSGCWLWSGSTNNTGYGCIGLKGKSVLAHRFSYKIFKGEPGKLFVCHKCDTPSCVNPDHLWLGTAKENNIDCGLKKRNPQWLLKTCSKGHDRKKNFKFFGLTFRCAECVRLYQQKKRDLKIINKHEEI